MTHRIEVQDLSKRYRIGSLRYDLMLREQLVEFVKHPFGKHPFGFRRQEPETIWALRDVSFRVEDGEVIGIIGRNGAGKSTLLKILSKITYPTSGYMKVKGRVASLLEVGTGFHDELTGRENVYLNGSILGMKKRKVDQHFDAIIAFAGVEQFIDTPVKRYSSGMRLRLGFAVAAHLDPDVLVVDEVLAVGDAGFQKKCLGAMEELRGSGRTVLFVSHNLAAVENLCSRAIWIDAGKVRMDGGARKVITAYMGMFTREQGTDSKLLAMNDRLGSGEIRYTKLEYLTHDEKPHEVMRCGESVILRLHYHAEKIVRYPSFGFQLFTEMGTLLTQTGNIIQGVIITDIKPGDGCIDVEIDVLNLLPAQYTLSLWITAQGGTPVYDGDVRTVFVVEPSNIYPSGRMPESRHGIIYFPQRWKVPGKWKPAG